MAALANAKQAELEARERAATGIVQARLQIPPRNLSRAEFSVFAEWCDEKELRAVPAKPSTLAFFLLDSVALGISRLEKVVEGVSAVHEGLADPTLSPCVTAALATIAPIPPPRSWPKEQAHLFSQLPRSLQTWVAEHQERREKEVRRIQTELQKLKLKDKTHGNSSPTTEPAHASA